VSLLSDIEADHHNELLERGNLRKRQSIHAPFAPRVWESQGYLARAIRSTCQNCRVVTESLMGIFHVETSGSNRQEQIIPLKGFQLPPSAPAGMEWTPTQTAACLHCIPEAFLENSK